MQAKEYGFGGGKYSRDSPTVAESATLWCQNRFVFVLSAVINSVVKGETCAFCIIANYKKEKETGT